MADMESYRQGAKDVLDAVEDWHTHFTSNQHRANCACCAANRGVTQLLKQQIASNEWPEGSQGGTDGLLARIRRDALRDGVKELQRRISVVPYSRKALATVIAHDLVEEIESGEWPEEGATWRSMSTQ